MFKDKKCGCSMAAGVLAIIGAINWGLVGLGNFFGGDWNVVNIIFGRVAWLENVIYILVGLSGLALIFGCKCKECCKVEKSEVKPV